MSPEAFEARAHQGLLADGGRVHQEPGEVEAPGGEKRRGTEQGTLQLKHKLKLIKNWLQRLMTWEEHPCLLATWRRSSTTTMRSCRPVSGPSTMSPSSPLLTRTSWSLGALSCSTIRWTKATWKQAQIQYVGARCGWCTLWRHWPHGCRHEARESPDWELRRYWRSWYTNPGELTSFNAVSLNPYLCPFRIGANWEISKLQEIKESVELPLTHPEYYEEMGIKPPKGVRWAFPIY